MGSTKVIIIFPKNKGKEMLHFNKIMLTKLLYKHKKNIQTNMYLYNLSKLWW